MPADVLKAFDHDMEDFSLDTGGFGIFFHLGLGKCDECLGDLLGYPALIYQFDLMRLHGFIEIIYEFKKTAFHLC